MPCLAPYVNLTIQCFVAACLSFRPAEARIVCRINLLMSDSTYSAPSGNTFLRLLFLRKAQCWSIWRTSESVTIRPLPRIIFAVRSAVRRLLLGGVTSAIADE